MHISLREEKSESNWVLCELHHAFAPIFIPSVLRVCSPLLTKTVSGSPLFTNSLAWHSGSHEVCPSLLSQPSLPRVPFRCLLLPPTATAHHFLMTQNAFSHHDQKPKLTSRERKCTLSHNRDSRNWVGYRDDWFNSSVMSSRKPALCSAILSFAFDLRPEATDCSSAEQHGQIWWHLEEKGTLSCGFHLG